MSKKNLSDALDDLAETWDPDIGMLEAATDPVGFVNAVADELRDNRAEAIRLRRLLFETYANCYRFGSCTTLDDREANVTYDGDCIDCDLCASDHCDIDGWEIPPGGDG